MIRVPPDSLRDRVALVTGAGSGIGKAAALALAAAGAKIGALGRSRDELDETVGEIARSGGEAVALEADVADTAQMERAVAELDRRWSRIDIVVANAGINGVWAPLEQLAPEEWDQTIAINLRGTYLTVKYAVPALKRRGGSVVIVSSVNGTRMFSNTGASAYSTSKAGQVAFGRMVALELAKSGVRVNTICPGAIETRIGESTEKRSLETVKTKVEFPEGSIPLTGGRPGRAEQVGHLVWFLASDFSSHITGAEVFIDGAESLLEG